MEDWPSLVGVVHVHLQHGDGRRLRYFLGLVQGPLACIAPCDGADHHHGCHGDDAGICLSGKLHNGGRLSGISSFSFPEIAHN